MSILSHLITCYYMLSHLIYLITCFAKDRFFVHNLFRFQICSFFERSLLSPKCRFCHILSHVITCYHILSTLSHVLLRIDILYIVFFAFKFVLFLNVVSYHRNVDFVTCYHMLSLLIYLITYFAKDRYFVHSLFRVQICSFFERSLFHRNVDFVTSYHMLSHLIYLITCFAKDRFFVHNLFRFQICLFFERVLITEMSILSHLITCYHMLSHLIYLITCFAKDRYFVHSLFRVQICSFFERSLLPPKCRFCHMLSHVITSYLPYHMFC